MMSKKISKIDDSEVIMHHFGLKVMNSKQNGLHLTKENYCVINRKTSLTTLDEFMFTDNHYEMMPKKWVLWYFGNMKDYLSSLPKYKEKLYLTERLEYITKEIEKYQKLPEDYHIHILKKAWDEDSQGLEFEDYVIKKTDDLKQFVDSFDLTYDIMGRHYSEIWCDALYKDIILNYEFNLAYLSQLSRISFKRGVTKFKKNNPDFIEINDLTKYYGKSGYYILIVDDYKQLYVGKATDLPTRIRQHWNARKDFDRLIYPFGAVMTSKISIDSFRAFDITRILIYETDDLSIDEEVYIQQFDKKYVLNRIKGGKINVYSSFI